MKTCDVAVIGLGIMGSATLHRLRALGVDAIGFDSLSPGEANGSSHGSCRIFRRFNFESPAYTALSDRAFAGWTALEQSSGRALLMPCPLVEAGTAGSALVQASRAAAGRAAGPRTGAELNAAWPGFRVPEDWDVVVQDTAGILLAETALQLLREAASDRIVPRAVRLERTPSDLILTTAAGERWTAGGVIIAAGPWVADFEPRLKPHVRITRQVVGWFEPINPALVQYPDFPLFIFDAKGRLVYGFPDFEGRGVKAAAHVHGRVLGHADEAAQEDARDEDLTPVRDALAAWVPAAAGRILRREVCLYTNTSGGDVDGSPAEEFILDRLPDDPRVIIASPCSGHGFKFAPAIGEIAAEMATDEGASAPQAFRLSRFSAFA